MARISEPAKSWLIFLTHESFSYTRVWLTRTRTVKEDKEARVGRKIVKNVGQQVCH